MGKTVAANFNSFSILLIFNNLKLSFSEKATKIYAIVLMVLTYITCLRHRNLQNIRIRILQIFVLIFFNESATNNLRQILY